MKFKVYNLQGKVTGEAEASDAVFGVPVKPAVVHQVFVAQMGNQRASIADTKKRGEVRGGGKKPWAQKGTGRARHGSTRSPIWVGGGVAFGPTSERNFKSKINKATRRLATKMVLSDKAKSEAIYVVNQFDFSEPKTKLFAGFLKSLAPKQHSFLVLTAGKDAGVMRQTNNLPKIITRRAEDANVMDIMNKQAIIVTVAALAKLETVLV